MWCGRSCPGCSSRTIHPAKGSQQDWPPHASGGSRFIEVLVAAAIMGIAVAGVLGGLSTASRNAAKLTQMDRAALLARQKMDEILVDPSIPRKRPLQGIFDWNVAGGTTAGWRAQVLPFEVAPSAGAGNGCWIASSWRSGGWMGRRAAPSIWKDSGAAFSGLGIYERRARLYAD